MFGRRASFIVRAPAVGTLIVVAACIIISVFDTALATEPYDNPDTEEGWAWSQIEHGEVADFNKRCCTADLDPTKDNDVAWQNACRILTGRFIQDILTKPPWRERVPIQGVQLIGARIVDDLDLANARLVRATQIVGSRIEGAVDLIRARTDSLVLLSRCQFDGNFDAHGFHAESDLFLRHGVIFKKDVNFYGAIIDGDVDMSGARFEATLNAIGSHVGGSVDMSGARFDGDLVATSMVIGRHLLMNATDEGGSSFNSVYLNRASVAGLIDMRGGTFRGMLNADGLQVGGNLVMGPDKNNITTFDDIILTGAKVGGQLTITGATLDGALEASLLEVGGLILLGNGAHFKDVHLIGAKTDSITLLNASFDGEFDAQSLKVGRDVHINGCAFTQTVIMFWAVIGANLSVSGNSLVGLDLSGASVAGYLMLGTATNNPSFAGEGLDLRGTHVGGLADERNAWPPPGKLHLNGFTFDQLGGPGQRDVDRNREMRWWDREWARLDLDFNPTSYTQLAAVMTKMGERDASDEIRFRGRVQGNGKPNRPY